MKLSKQERIGALIILAIVILALGAFLLVKPKFEEVGRTQATLTQRRTELQEAQERQKLKPELRTKIEAQYEEGEHLADMFFPELSSYEADNTFRAFLQQLDFPVVVEELTVEEPATQDLSVAFYTPSEVSYALKTYVNQGVTVELTEEEAKNEARMTALMTALSESQTVGASQVAFTVSTLTRNDLMKFADAVNDYRIREEGSAEPVRKAMSISGIVLSYTEVEDFYSTAAEDSVEELSRIGRNYMREDGFKLDEGDEPENPETPENPENPENPDDEDLLDYTPTYQLSDTLTFLSIERMQDPKAQLDAQDGVTG